MENKFSQLLKFYRQRMSPKLSQQALSDKIGKTKQYIYLLENDGQNTAPPTLDICQTLAKQLGLSEDEEKAFIFEAFKYRIKNNWDFYTYTHSESHANQEKPEIEQSLSEQLHNSFSDSCSYYMDWMLKASFDPFSQEMKDYFIQTATTFIQDMQHTVDDIRIKGRSIQLSITLSSQTAPKDFLLGIQRVTSSALKTQFPSLPATTPLIWEDSYTIQSLSSPSALFSEETSKTSSLRD